VEAKNKLQEVIETGKVRPTRRASSVSASGSPSLYDKKSEPTQEDFENMTTEQLREYGRKTGFIDPDAEMREGVRQARPGILSQF
jgi:hypothetical protein